MVYLSGYKIREQFARGIKYTLYRCIRESDNTAVVIKLLNRDYPSAEEITDFIHEYQMMAKFDCDGIIRVYDLIQEGRYAIVMEEIEGDYLSEVIKNASLSIEDKMHLAIKMAESLVQLHKHNVIHKDITPSNFIWSPKTGKLKLTNFSSATEMCVETPQFDNLNSLECSLAYISPEQTGRINRTLDYRTDLYSLGICLYELFTGRLPFESEDKSELIYCHIAKTPRPPHEVDPEVPEFISDIIMKLTAKAAEERYQSALGLKKDLEFCLANFDALVSGLAGFEPGQGDVSDRFEVPHRLYGRDAELEELRNSFEIVSEGGALVWLVGGPSGVGKTSLIHKISNLITAKKGYFISGRFGPFMQGTPFQGLSQAFGELVKQLLVEPQQKLDFFKRRLLSALGGNGRLIIELVPELEKIIGPQPDVSELNPREAQNRFRLTFREFFKALAGPGFPLVVFLDDLQWSDAATLDLLEYVLEAGDLHYVFIIGAYRESEAEAIRPYLQKLESLTGNRGLSIRRLSLKPLEFQEINQLVADTLRTDTEEAKPLSRIIQRKTNGNPFFIRQMLNTLYQQNAFVFNPEKGCWSYDTEKVEAAEISCNVLDLLLRNLELLPEGCRKLLSLASVIGNQFDLKTVSSISKEPPEMLAENLKTAIEKEILLPLDSNYRYITTVRNETILQNFEMRFGFTHDRIRQAIYTFIPEKEKRKMHYRIGRQLLKSYRETGRAELIFDLTNHLNKARSLIKSWDERYELAELNILAGRRAMKSSVFMTALTYFEEAEGALLKEEWASMPSRRFSFLLDKASAAMLSGGFDKAEAFCGELDLLAENSLQKCSVSSVRANLYFFQGRLFDCIDELRRALRLLGFNIPDTDEELERAIQDGLREIREFTARSPVEEIVDLPSMIDREKNMAMQLFYQLDPPALHVSPKLFTLSVVTMFNLTLRYGVTPLSCKAISDSGIIFGQALSDYKTGYRLGEVAFALLDRFNAESQKAPVYFIIPFLSHWVKHYREALDYFDLSYKAGIETGDLMHATYALATKAFYLTWVGRNLDECREKTEEYIAFIRQAKPSAPLLLCEMALHFIEKLKAVPKHGELADFEERDRAIMRKIKENRNAAYLARFCQYNSFASYVMGDFEKAAEWIGLSENLDFSLQADLAVPNHYLLKGLILVGRWKSAPPGERVRIEAALDEILRQLECWAENCPDNFAHKYYLLSAETAAIKNEPLETIVGLYRRASDSIAAGDFIQFKALISEQYGKFWLERGDEIAGKAYMREAYYLYGKWGADGKTALMDEKWGFKDHCAVESRGPASVACFVDMNSILKFTQAISGEIRIEKLLTTLMKILIENAGAQRGCILLKNELDGNFYVEAYRDLESGRNQVAASLPLYASEDLCAEIVNYVIRTREPLVIRDACSDPVLRNNPYVMANLVRSVMCIPILHQNRLKGMVYLENNLSDNVFTAARFETIKILASQAAVSIENARLYENMEEMIRERTSQLNAINEKLRELSLRDSLTGMYNRRYLQGVVSERVKSYVKEHTKQDGGRRVFSPEAEPIGVFLIDIDYFKDINDTYGHAVGDSVLISISKAIKQMLNCDDVLIRWGGEEFLLVLFSRSTEDYRRFARRVVEEIGSTPVRVSENRVIYKTCSLGYCEIPLSPEAPELITLEQAIRISDYALYCAKERGRNCATRFSLKTIDLDEEARRSLGNLSKSDFNEEFFEIEYL